MGKNENYAKSIKNWLTVISSVTFIVNTFQVSEIESVFLYSFTYLSSIGLAFYNLSPKGGQAKTRRVRMVQSAIACVAFNFIGNIVGGLHPIVKLIMLYIIKVAYLIFASLAIIYTFKDDSDLDTVEEKNVRINVRRKLREKEEAKPFEVREKKKDEKKRFRKFISNKKVSKEDIK
ncbi:hypothetical protein IGJ99_000724 [Enterococcus sp. AZ095b]|uniref:hypothetical protein n=1 Tax=Enterococcus sp. AZ095b TaxID=2774791 RepID=UPI003F1FBB83